MSDYRPPLQDMEFVLGELAGLPDLAALPGYEEVTAELAASVLEEAGKIAAEVVAPLNRNGDLVGARLENGEVVTAPGWDGAYRALRDGGWIGVSSDPAYGGMGLPGAVGAAVQEMWHAANMAFALCPMLSQSAVKALSACGSQAQKQKYLSRLVSGEWAGTMNLTEVVAGSDLGAIRTKAVRSGDHYLISGQKIFITYGDHRLTDNIIHMVLARTPEAPAGVKGISLFIVPKFLVNEDGSLGARNDLKALSLEHKLGIHASPTAVMSYGDNGGAIGYLVGEENRGLEYMFVMMNSARLNVGLEGLGIADRAYQKALAYARERVQGKPPGGTSSSTIVDHPDVRRMLMTMKARIEAMRALAYVAAAALDRAAHDPDAATRDQALRYAELLNPIVKGCCTEAGVEVASEGVQIHGGMGFIEETGAAQYYRDARITTIYEGTTAIQANDLVGRKLLRDKGETARAALAEAARTVETLAAGGDETLKAIAASLGKGVMAAHDAVDWLFAAAAEDARLPGAASVPLLRLFGVVLGGHQMARAALAARRHLDAGEGDARFYDAKIKTAHFYADSILPQSAGLLAAVTSGARTVMSLDHDQL
ncbi:MAG: acyl-CoA dehydrogenase C-terminal domain-containing protein [Alphaproteobacteria bacterium]|nr:acyl-CoA dehydrogenase C-terminal domain-containing protein [Alphaproteobacteria bacterium]MDE2011908.1 acyl-CoA dehydrogenase C-terminal domain-containing protein [Alphaproteobacteria bacterium]MDE2073923.1 acyl-CoA dehydrogenase C-terminal domain-containing protein [Alphaproteobacteria bacterium]